MTLADLQRQLKRCQENLNDATRELERLEFVRDAIDINASAAESVPMDDTTDEVQEENTDESATLFND